MNNAAILLSGGLDSTCVGLLEKPQIAYFIDYGQISAEAERKAANFVSAALGVRLVELKIDLRPFGQGLLAGKSEMNPSNNPEWWPFRNQALITVAAMRSIKDRVNQLIIGTVKSDSARHCDGKPEFIKRMDQLLRMQEGEIKLSAPAIDITSSELAQVTSAPEKLLLKTFSCHNGNFHCGNCPGCQKRADFFGW